MRTFSTSLEEKDSSVLTRSQREDPGICSWVPVIVLSVCSKNVSIEHYTYESIFGNEIRKHVPLSTVTHQVRVAEKMRHESTIQRLASGLNHTLQEKIRALQLVPEKHVRLTQLEGLGQIVLSHHLNSDHVQTREDPASSGTFLCRCLSLNTDLIGVI